MKQKLFNTLILFFLFTYGSAQSYMNEWIDYNKTYYKFKVGAKGLYRISKTQLSSLGIEETDAAHFQLWNRGQEVPIYTSVASGPLPTNGFLEFWGQTNDGTWESRLYIRPEFQINPDISLFTDTSVYFLTVNTQGTNKRFTQIANDLSSPLSPEPFFMHTAKVNYRNQYSQGFAGVVGSDVFSSSYDNGEGFVSGDITPTANFFATLNNLFVSPTGPDAQFRYTAAGRRLNVRNVSVLINNTIVDEREMNYFSSINTPSYINIPLSNISSGTARIDFKNLSTITSDRMVVGMCELVYPRQFNFGGSANFEFQLPESVSGQKIVIRNFSSSQVPPVLYDFTNGLRIIGQVGPSPAFEITYVLPPSNTTRQLLVSSLAPSNLTRSISPFVAVNFIDYSKAQNQGNYIIISNPSIYVDKSGVNQVEAYAQYRSSAKGGSYKTIIADINQLIDQFGWGIKNNPLSIKSFLRYARNNFTDKEQYCLLVGKGVAPNLARINEQRNMVNILNLVPTFGTPASDVMLASDEGNVVPLTHIGRLNVLKAEEVKDYLDKVKLYEDKQANTSCSIDDELWKKQVLHIGGANDFLGEQIMYYLNQYKRVVEDTLMGADVFTLQKSSLTNIQVLSGEKVNQMFTNGFGLMTYFGHSSAGTLEFNLDNPENYPYSGKFPVFLVNGCQAGNLFFFDSTRLTGSYILSEKYVVSAPLKGAIAFIASTHLGIVNYLNLYTDEFYHQLTKVSYGKSLGKIMTNIADTLISRYTLNDFFVRLHAEEIALHGDPAIIMYHYDKPDYAVEAKNVKINPEFISIAEDNYSINIKMHNIGRVTDDSLFVRVERIKPDNTIDTLLNKNIKYIPYSDSLSFQIELDPTVDKGLNKIRITLDPDNIIEEVCETNNTITKEYFIYEDEIRPVYPYNFSIVNNSDFKFYASTANPLSKSREYIFQIDTTIHFNSSLFNEKKVISSGGLVELSGFNIALNDNYVYYWRVGVMSSNGIVKWNNHSFMYRSDLDDGYNQSHYYQFTSNTYNDINLDSIKRNFEFKKVKRKIRVKNGLFPFHDFPNNEVYLDLQKTDTWRCNWNTFSIYVFSPKSLIPWRNTMSGGSGMFGSFNSSCQSNVRRFFEYPFGTQNFRNNARLFLENIVPDSAIVLVANQSVGAPTFQPVNNSFIGDWMNDTLVYGAGNSIYHTLKKNGFSQLDSFTRNIPFVFIYQKGNTEFARQFVGEKRDDLIDVVVDIPGQLSNGSVESPWMGPMNKWNTFYWDGGYPDGKSLKDSSYFELIGKRKDGSETSLATVLNAKDTAIGFIDAKEYPFVKMKLYAQDSIDLTPFQLDYWRLTGDHVPEGALAPNIKFVCPDTADAGRNVEFAIAFKNISKYAFDSIKLKLILSNNQSFSKEIVLPKAKALISEDTIMIRHQFDTKELQGLYSLYLMVNPDDDQPEKHLFNNFIYKNIFIRKDDEAPWLDVTFDGVHILNRDIVSAKPNIAIKINDNNKFLPILKQDSVVLNIRFPDQSIRNYQLGSDSARFTASDLSAGINELLINLLPSLSLDGEYELSVGAKQGSVEQDKLFKTYRINFTVINKPMISNMFNYPNPFTTSTAFVFTLTGSEIPQNIRIQIMTISGKVIREITKNELGTLRIGRNITEYKWDGTDQYGNQLGNGVYLYRVITNLNGKKLDKYEESNSGTDKYFTNGYGKMYLMR